MASKQACQARECCMPSVTLRSLTSLRSRPAQKWSPSPLSTAAFMVAGMLTNAVCSCVSNASLMELRLAGRFRRMCSTAPLCSRRSRDKALSGPLAARGWKLVVMVRSD